MFDASPLVFLDVLGYAGLLPDLHRVFVLPAVAEELVPETDLDVAFYLDRGDFAAPDQLVGAAASYP